MSKQKYYITGSLNKEFEMIKEFTPGTALCRPILYELRMNDGTVKGFRFSDVKKCQEVKHGHS